MSKYLDVYDNMEVLEDVYFDWDDYEEFRKPKKEVETEQEEEDLDVY